MENSKLNPEEARVLQLLREKENQDLLKRSIIGRTEAKVKDKFSDQELDRKLEVRRMLDLVNDYWRVDETVLKSPVDYEAIFPQVFYKEIYRLKGWKYEGVIAKKPWVISKYTNEIIYYRFSYEVLPILKMINPFIVPDGRRQFKHHQYLTPGARLKLARFISEAVELMKECTEWNEFRIKYSERYKVPYQLKIGF